MIAFLTLFNFAQRCPPAPSYTAAQVISPATSVWGLVGGSRGALPANLWFWGGDQLKKPPCIFFRFMDFMYQIVLEKENALGNNKFCVYTWIFLENQKGPDFLNHIRPR